MHLDMSGMSLNIKSLCYISKHGLRKSRTLLSVHMCGINLKADGRKKLREALKVIRVDGEQSFQDLRLEHRRHLAKVDN